MSDKYVLRHFDYVLQIPTLTAGARKRLPLVLDTDSQFCLRGRAIHTQIAGPAVHTGGGLSLQAAALANYFDRFTGPDNDDLAEDVTRFLNESRVLGQYGLPLPVRPPMVYPAGGTIYTDVYNAGNADLTNLEVYYRGQKIFAPGVLDSYTYPANPRTQPFQFPHVQTLTQAQTLLNNVFTVNTYADFALRSLSIGSKNPATSPSVGDNYYEMHIQLRDVHGRAYSNVPVHVDVCFGSLGSFDGSGAIYPATFGPYLPPLFAPEIYLPANGILYYDLYRADAYVGGLSAVDLRLAFSGANVFKR